MSGDESSEFALWSRGLAGESEAIATLFDLHRQRVFRHAFRMLQNSADAEDATATAFLELWRRRSQVRVVEGSVLPWLLVTATNAARNLKRARRRYHRLLATLPHADPHPSAEAIAVGRLTSDANVAAALNHLALSDARLFALVALEEYSVADAARVLGIAPGTARTRLHRMRAKLQDRLGETTLAGYLAKESR